MAKRTSNSPASYDGQIFQAPPPGDTHQTVSLSTSSAQSSAFQGDTKMVRISATQECWYLIDSDPTATTSKTHLPGGLVEYRSVTPGHKIAAILASGTGTLYIEEMQ